MKVSELNKKINFMKKVKDEGPIENLEGTYIPVIENIWSKKVKLLGKENIKLGLEHNKIQVNFIVRSRNDINEELFIQYKGVIYNIVGIEELKGNSNFMLIATIKKQVMA